jgi:hypothetical protein
MSRIHECTISLRFLGSQTSGFHDTMLTLLSGFEPLLLGGGRGRVINPLVEVTVNSKEENY